MKKEKRRMHAFNLFKLLSLIIITSCLEVLELTVNKGLTRDDIYLFSQVPDMVEYLLWSLGLLIVGIIIWYITEAKEDKKSKSTKK